MSAITKATDVRRHLRFAVTAGRAYLAQRLAYGLDRPVNTPAQVTLSVTRACGARCVMCDFWKHDTTNELPASDWIRILGQLRAWMGPSWVSITGGEALQKKGIFEILRYCREHGIRTKVGSNGMPLHGATLERVIEEGPDFLSLSIDSPEAAVHDALRGVPGLFERCAHALGELRRHRTRMVVGVAAVIMEDNYRQLPQLARWAAAQGADRVLFQPLQPNFGSPRAPDWYRRHPQWVRDSAGFGRVADALLELKREGVPIWNDAAQFEHFKAYIRDPAADSGRATCPVRYHLLNVDPFGEVTFCGTVRHRVGNLADGRPSDLWHSAAARRVREDMGVCRAPCTMNCYRSRSLADQVRLFWFLWRRLQA